MHDFCFDVTVVEGIPTKGHPSRKHLFEVYSGTTIPELLAEVVQQLGRPGWVFKPRVRSHMEVPPVEVTDIVPFGAKYYLIPPQCP